MDDFLIEQRIRTLLSLIDDLQLDILRLEAKAVSKAIDKKLKTKDRVLREHFKELNTLINSRIGDIDEDLIKVITDNANLYLKNDIKTYSEAFKKGVVKAEPVITKANKLILAKSIETGKKIIDNAIKDMTINSNNQIASIITKALKDFNGGMSRDEAILEAATKIYEKGFTITDGAGRNWQDITAYVRMNVKTIGNKTYISQHEQLAQEIGIPDEKRKVETSSHWGARPEHAKWQGRIFSYKDFVKICKPNTITGICGINCRHTYYEFIEGISKPVFPHYNEEENKKRYVAEQKQRYIEKNIRAYKQQQAIAEELGLDDTKAKAKIKEWQARAREHTKAFNLVRNYAREKIG